MKALFLRENHRLSLEETDVPKLIEPTDAIVRVTAASICGSDLHYWHGTVPTNLNFIIGHEFVGIVQEVGDRVSVPAAVYCGTCPNCRDGREFACYSKVGMFGGGGAAGNLPGAHAEMVQVPFADVCLIPIPEGVSDKQALLVGDVLSTGYFAVKNGNPQPGEDIAVFGAG